MSAAAEIEYPQETTSHPALPQKAMLYVQATALMGFTVLILALANWESTDVLKYAGFLTIGLFSSGMKISVPGVTGTLSLTFLFVLFGIVDLTGQETIWLGAVMTVVQCYWDQPKRPRPAQVVFNVASMSIAIAAAQAAYHSGWLASHHADQAVCLAAATLVLFVMNTAPVAMAVALAEERNLLVVWRECYFWSMPYYLGGAAVAQVASLAERSVSWQPVLLTGPVVYLVYRTYRLYLARLEGEKKMAEEMSALHLRTIEALALAIEAKDNTTSDHIQRVQVYAMELARELDLTQPERDALRAAALLHDIGKLAVPEHIISKPGRLTPEEFEKMKIHPVVGAEILERVQFPYPVVPIVRAHHEKWDGAGYPAGLSGEDIPIGARIISAVDCLDALASDRQYRRALPLDDAMKVVVSESGKAFDPRIVELLHKHYIQWERMAQDKSAQVEKLSMNVKIERGAAPGAGFESSSGKTGDGKPAAMDFLSSIASARQEVQALFEISQDLGNSLSLDETLSVLAVRLRKIIPHHSLAIWIRREAVLIPEYVTGEDYRLFSSLEIPVGHGLSGWVAENGKPIVNGNPSVEPGYLNDPSKFSALRAAVAVPLEGMNGTLGVLTLYHMDRDAFNKDHLRVLLGISSKIGMSIENALRFRQVESSATTDFLTSLPNARSLFLQLDAEVSRASRSNQPMAVLVADLDGFKQINDRFGHLEGNKVLKAVAAGFKSACREYDYVARMGGDEFVVLLPGVRPVDADIKAHQFQSVVANVCQNLFGEKLLTVSTGVAHFPVDGEDAEQLLAEADRRMYKEKRDRKLPPSERRKSWESTFSVTTLQ
ncbi:MAG TPA: HD domain-containing phosphohydrolase [Bryobacteraceae bacterium]|jgi:diguanylate cyclase (GGDEF)-like protein/putative nucleotidyltransferase with HDIG domain